MNYRICRPGEMAIRVATREEAIKNARALSMRAVDETFNLDADMQQTASVWETDNKGDDSKIAVFRRGEQIG